MKNTLLILCVVLSNLCLSQTVDITITGIRNNKGSIRRQFFTSAENFNNHVPALVKTVSKSTMKNGTISVSYPGLAAGLYGIALLDDENGNKEMDYGMVLPDEGFGFSDYYHKGMSHPKFEQFDFWLKSNETKKVKIAIRYM